MSAPAATRAARHAAPRAAPPGGLRTVIAALFMGAVVALLALWPAAWVAPNLATVTGQRLVLLDVRGTVWRGSAQLALAGGPDSRDRLALPGRLAWHWGWGAEPESSSRGPSLRLRHSGAMREAAALLFLPGWGRLDIQWVPIAGNSSSLLSLPAAWLNGLGAPWNTLHPEGSLELHVVRLRAEFRLGADPQTDLALRLVLKDLQARVSTLPRLGSYELQAVGRNELRLTLGSQPGSALILDGQGQWRRGERLEFRGVAQAAPGQEAALSNLLNIIGRRDGARSVIQL